MRHREHLSRRIAGAALTVASVQFAGCSDDAHVSDDGPACYPLDPELPINPPLVPHCDWQPEEFPLPPEGYARTNPVSIWFVPSDDEPCDPCNVELFDMLLETEIERECDAPYAEFERGCYSPPKGGPGTGSVCYVRGIYASDCTPMN
jgi:hypothetical protein